MKNTSTIPPEVHAAWERFLGLWDELASPCPFGIDWDEEVVGEVLTLYRKLERAGVRFAPAFAADMEALEKRVKQDEEGSWPEPRTMAERLWLAWAMAKAGDDCCEFEDRRAAYRLGCQMRAGGIEVPPDLARFTLHGSSA